MLKPARLAVVLPIAVAALAPLLLGAGAAGAATVVPAGTCQPIVPFRAENFERSTRIDNKFLPLVPGTELTLEGRANRGGGILPHTVVFTVTDLVKKIDGVHSLVVWDVDKNEGEIQEAELSFWAQDKKGNVWNTGEYPEEFENGAFTGAPNTWFSGLRGALAGIHMLAEPRLGTPRYLQGFSPTIEFLDCAQVFARNQTTCVPLKCYNNVLVTDETSPLEDPNAHQRKFHAPGVGIIKVTAVNDPEGETLVLIRLKHLDAPALAHARQEALKLERHAYQTNALYKQTPPMVRCDVRERDDRDDHGDGDHGDRGSREHRPPQCNFNNGDHDRDHGGGDGDHGRD
jgi:hypothetical protein